MGGPGRFVEVDEAKFGKRKYNRGRVIDGTWFLVVLNVALKIASWYRSPSRRSDVLLDLIKTWIRPGTTIISDCWTTIAFQMKASYTRL